MEESRTKYILLKDRVGDNVEGNMLALAGLSTKTSLTHVLRGELLEAVPELEQPQDSRQIALVGIDHKKIRLVCLREDLTRLSDEEANLLLAISSLGERYDIFIDRKRLNIGLRIKQGRSVFVKVKGVTKDLVGVVWYKGELPPFRGTMFGVELIENPGQGTTDGMFRNKRYFMCGKDSGVFVSLDKIKLKYLVIRSPKPPEKEENALPNVGSRLETVLQPFSKGKIERKLSQGIMETILEIEQRVVTYIDDKPVRGIVRYIGEEKVHSGHHFTIAGLELDSRLGNGNGKRYGKQRFVCRRDFAVFVPIGTVIREKDFDSNPQRLQRTKGQEAVHPCKDEGMAKSLSYNVNTPGTACSRNSPNGLELPRQPERYSMVEHLTSELEAEKRKTEQLEMRQEQLEEELIDLQDQLRKKEEHEANLQERLRQKEEQETSLQDQLRQKEEQQASLQRQLRGKEQEVQELEETLSATQQTVNEQRRQQPRDWVISQDQIHVTEKRLGTGGWGSVVEGTFRGYKVAVKQIHELILSPHNRLLFEREMNMASRFRHPCLLQFIGATNDDGSPLFVTELMESSLRALLQQCPLLETEIFTISLDVAHALNYLHLNRPSPIIHRDISSANVLLWRQGDQWRGKVSDYGTANFMRQTMTVAPGAAIYCAPEALTSRQSTKVDVYSFGVLLCEMCIREMPDPQRRDQQIALVKSSMLRGLIRRCVHSEPGTRPTMEDIISELEQYGAPL